MRLDLSHEPARDTGLLFLQQFEKGGCPIHDLLVLIRPDRFQFSPNRFLPDRGVLGLLRQDDLKRRVLLPKPLNQQSSQPAIGIFDRLAGERPDDILGAESQGMIGYLLVQALGNELRGREVVALLTQVRVDPDDPAFEDPTKPIGPVYDEQEARRLAVERGWAVAADGPRFRRVVASPEPREIVELESIERLLAAGAVVVCAGGGGIPV
ncbi:MAG TPA: hypothetical protein VFZ25_14365, partial [Chloroflexota bacterium]|nr:hypothetical protein [Chloroflexota bacterium]